MRDTDITNLFLGDIQTMLKLMKSIDYTKTDHNVDYEFNKYINSNTKYTITFHLQQDKGYLSWNFVKQKDKTFRDKLDLTITHNLVLVDSTTVKLIQQHYTNDPKTIYKLYDDIVYYMSNHE
ncbi:TPA: hypothetical protein SFZ76_001798 [Campylobacter jejuni]|nr:hypothetical protein [Campylobacter jejuni]